MKKTLLSALVAVLGFATQTTAQSSFTATLIHDNDIKTFYGIGALRQAHSAATHGDVITLSSGTFTSTDITKAITLRGAGMEYDSLTTTEPTIIEGNFSVTMPHDSILNGKSLNMEGIYFDDSKITFGYFTKNPQFIKCRFYNIGRTSNNTINYGLNGATFINCIISYDLMLQSYCSATLINSYVSDVTFYDNNSSTYIECQNCVIRCNPRHIYRGILRNCYVFAVDLAYSLPSTTLAYNCISNSSNTFYNQMGLTNKVAAAYFVFKTWTGGKLNNFKNERLELTDEAKTKYLGTDGTEVGIYGGSLPFEARISNPQITKLNVASKSTADGKLSVDIEVKAAE